MRTRIIFGLAVAAASASLAVMAGEDKATSAPFVFWMNSNVKGSFVLSSQADIDAFAAHPVTYRAGETVVAIPQVGEPTSLVPSAAPSAGSVAFSPDADGVWRLENSNGAVAILGIPWGVFGGGWSQSSGTESPFKMHTEGKGPNRGGKYRSFPDVAYSGDSWRGASSAESTLRIVSPNGVVTNQVLAGTGATPFSFRGLGTWTVQLTMEDGTILESVINVFGGFVLSYK